MKSQDAFNKVVCDVNSKFGAPLGRFSNELREKPTDRRIYDRKVPLVYDGVYDKGGAYWGSPNNLRVEYTLDLTYIRFYRA